MNILRRKIEEILRIEDIEGYIGIHGAPDDEYDSEAAEIAVALEKLKQNELTENNVLSVVALIWARYFNLDDEDVSKRMPYLEKAVQKILS